MRHLAERSWSEAIAPLQLLMLSTSARIRVRTSSFLRAAARHKSEAKLRSIRGAARTSYRPDTLSRLRTNIKLHDWRSMSRSLRPASRAPQAQCRQSMLRRRRPPTCGRRYRAPRSWPPSAKRRSKKLSPSSTTSVATPVWAMVLKAPHRGFFDTVPCKAPLSTPRTSVYPSSALFPPLSRILSHL